MNGAFFQRQVGIFEDISWLVLRLVSWLLLRNVSWLVSRNVTWFVLRNVRDWRGPNFWAQLLLHFVNLTNNNLNFPFNRNTLSNMLPKEIFHLPPHILDKKPLRLQSSEESILNIVFHVRWIFFQSLWRHLSKRSSCQPKATNLPSPYWS